MSNVSQWSTAAASNNAATPNGFPEGQTAGSLNDCSREVMASVRRDWDDRAANLTTTGTGAAYVLTTTNTHAALTDIGLLAFIIHTANTGAATLAVDGLTAKNMFLLGAALAASDLTANTVVAACYNAGQDRFDIISSKPNNNASNLTTGTLPEARLSAVVIASPTNADARELGYRAAPQNAQTGTNYTLVLADAGKGIDLGSGFTGTVTIPANASVAFPIGSVVIIDNDSGGSRTVAITTDTLEDTAGNVGSRTLADNGQATIRKIAATKWRIGGSGVS